MSFLAPFWLGLAGLAAVPLLLHLMRRRIGNRVEFPGVRYLRRAEEEHSKDLKLRNLLLMLLRVLAVLALALAAARPSAQLPGGGHAPTAMAVVLDNSLSTTAIVAGEPLLERLRRAARDVVGQAQATDRVWLVTADGVVTSGAPATVLAAIARVEPLAGAGDLPGAVRRAAALARGAGLQAAEVAVLTDGQASSWQVPLALGDVRVSVLAPAAEPPLNRAVVDLAARPPRWTPRGSLAARVRGPGDSVTYRILLGERTLARGTALADARGGEVTIGAAPPERGWVAARIELEPDELRGDDVGHGAVWIGPAPGVRTGPGAGAFARGAVEALYQAGAARVGDDVAVVGAEELTRLPAVAFAPADPVQLGAANRALERAGVPWRFGAVVRGEAQAASADSLLARDVRVALRYELSPVGAAPAETLATVSRRAWIVAGPGYVLVASPLDPAATTLPVRAGFAPWVAQLVGQRLTGEGGVVVRAAPLAPVTLPPGAESLLLPDGTSRALGTGEASAPAAPGVYLVRRGARTVGALVVNVEPEETELRRLSGGELARRIEARATSVHGEERAFAGAPWRAGARRPLAPFFLGLALAALLVETVIAARAALGRRGGAAPVPATAG